MKMAVKAARISKIIERERDIFLNKWTITEQILEPVLHLNNLMKN